MIIRAENGHDCLIDNQQDHAQWVAYLLMRPFISENLTQEQQIAMTDFIVSSADTPVWSLTFVTDLEKPETHLMMEVETNENFTYESDSPMEQALSTSIVAALGGFLSAKVDPQMVELLEAHISPSEELSADSLIFPDTAITNGRYRLPDSLTQDIYLDERSNYAHLQSFSGQHV